MRIISRKILREFSIRHPQAKQSLDNWYRLAIQSQWQSPTDIKSFSKSADILPENRVVFNISGNKYRLIVKIEYKFQTIYIRFIGTHKEYDKINAKTI